MELVPCAVCGSTDHEVLVDKLKICTDEGKNVRKYVLHVDNLPVNYRNVCCKNCGLVFLNPRMTQAQSIAFYRDRYRDIYQVDGEAGNVPGYPFTRAHLGLEIYNAVVRVDLLQRLGYLREGIDALDIGSSLGALPAYLRARGARAAGVEISPFGQHGKSLFGLDSIHQVAFEDFETDARYQIITVCDVLEHLADPRAALEKVCKLLADDGIVLIEVPDVFKPRKSLMTFLSNAHLYTYSPNSLGNLLGRSGLKIVHFEYGGHCRNMRVVAARSDGRFEQRFEAFGVVDRALSDYNRAYSTWQRFLAGATDYDAACAELDTSVPSYGPVHFSQGDRLLGDKDYLGARRCFERCLESDYNEEDLCFNSGNLHAILALIAWQLGDLEYCRDHLNSAWAKAPNIYEFPFLPDLRRRGLFDVNEFVGQRGLLYPQMADLELALKKPLVAREVVQ